MYLDLISDALERTLDQLSKRRTRTSFLVFSTQTDQTDFSSTRSDIKRTHLEALKIGNSR